MFGFRRKQAQPAAAPSLDPIDVARNRLQRNLVIHSDAFTRHETAANNAHALMMKHERAMIAYTAALASLDGNPEPEFDFEPTDFDKAISEATITADKLPISDNLEKRITLSIRDAANKAEPPFERVYMPWPRLGDTVHDMYAADGIRVLKTPEALNTYIADQQAAGTLPPAAPSVQPATSPEIINEQRYGRAIRKRKPLAKLNNLDDE